MIAVSPQRNVVSLGVLFLSALLKLKPSLLRLPLAFGPIRRPTGVKVVDHLLVDLLVRRRPHRSNHPGHGLTGHFLGGDSRRFSQGAVGKAVLSSPIHRRDRRGLVVSDDPQELGESGETFGRNLQALGFRRGSDLRPVLPGHPHRDGGQSQHQGETDQHHILPLFGRPKRLLLGGCPDDHPGSAGNLATEDQAGDVGVAGPNGKTAGLFESKGGSGILGIIRRIVRHRLGPVRQRFPPRREELDRVT